MKRTKDTAAESQEKESVDSKLPLEPTKAAPRVVKMKGLTNELNDQIVKYLASKPYAEVANLLTSLSQAPTLDVEFK